VEVYALSDATVNNDGDSDKGQTPFHKWIWATGCSTEHKWHFCLTYFSIMNFERYSPK
jgi:hypothetical protein